MLNYSQRAAFARRGDAAIVARVNEAVAAVKAERDAERAAAIAASAAATAPVPFTEEEYLAARAVRSTLGWHRVVRVNAKSVTVATPYSWTDRIAREKVLEVRS